LDGDRYETLLVHGSPAPGDEPMADLIADEAVRARFLPSLGQPIRPHRDALALAQLTRIARRFRPDIVHTHMAKAGLLGRLAARAGGSHPRIVHTYHGHVLEGYFGPAASGAYRVAEARLARISDRLIGVSEATVDDLVRLGVAPRDRFRVIPLGLDLSAYWDELPAERARLRAELGVGEEETLVVYVGRLVPIKRLDLLLRATSEAIGSGAKLRLALVGDGEIRPALEGLAAELGLAKRARFMGYRRDLASIFAAADVAALSSANEGTPVSLIEAAAAGVPGVATAVGGVSEVVSEGTGLTVAPGDTRGLAKALARLTADPALRASMGSRARERALGRYSVERLIDEIDSLYAELLGGAR
jgi:glycosyltransferase involved in cell wall biosynthesis